MFINGKEYRIKETIYSDGKTEYTAQRAINFKLFKIWRNVIERTVSYYGDSIRFYCTSNTYKGCKDSLMETIHKREAAKNSLKKKKIYYFYD